jgi:CheY-like chemotaxis protein
MIRSEPAALSSNGSAMPSILVVDDDAGISGFLRLALIDEGYAVSVAANGQEALDHVREHCPNLILLDMNMPIMDGWEFCQKLRNCGSAEGSIPIVVMTAARDAANRSREVGAQGFLGKPFDLDHLFRVVSSILTND